MSNKMQCEIFIQTLTEMVEAQRQQKDAQRRVQCRAYADRFLTRSQGDAGYSLRPSADPGAARGSRV